MIRTPDSFLTVQVRASLKTLYPKSSSSSGKRHDPLCEEGTGLFGIGRAQVPAGRRQGESRRLVPAGVKRRPSNCST